MRELGGDGHGLELRVRFTRGFAPSGRASSSLGGYTEQPGGSAGSTVVTWGVEDADVFRPGEWYEVVFHLDAGAEASSFFELTFVATSDSRQPGVPAVDRMSGDYAFTYLRDEDNTVSRVSTEGTPIPLNLLTAPDFEVAPGDPPDDYEFIYPTTRRVECSPAGSFGGTCYLRYEPLDPSGTSVLQNVPLRVKPRDVFTAEAVVRCPPGPGDCIPTLALHARPETAVDGSRESTCTIPPDGKWYAIRLDLDHNFPGGPGRRGPLRRRLHPHHLGAVPARAGRPDDGRRPDPAGAGRRPGRGRAGELPPARAARRSLPASAHPLTARRQGMAVTTRRRYTQAGIDVPPSMQETSAALGQPFAHRFSPLVRAGS
jgi:hypothetical protein